ncbi:MAG TPA: N-acetyl-gamma-glutamyl-phosphate reductase [Mycobacteriales bacterium]
MGVMVAVAGASGYAGGELLRLVAAHPGLELGPLAAGESAGRAVSDVHPQLRSLAGHTFVPTDAATLGQADAVLLALPHGHSAALAAQLPASLPVVDLGADHRLRDASAWAAYYGGDHAGSWAYGLPELPGQRSSLTGAARIAGAGCHATAVNLALAPLLAARLVEPTDLAVVSVTGTSGAGRAAGASFTSAQVMGDVTAYKVGRHQHTAEMLQALGDACGEEVSISFTPVLAPLPRGILATCTARTTASAATLRQALDAAYWDEPFVDVLPEGAQPHTGATLGGNGAQLQVTVDDSAGRVVVTCALDNLVKGAAGQAIQCLNLALGLDETAGLTAEGVWP